MLIKKRTIGNYSKVLAKVILNYSTNSRQKEGKDNQIEENGTAVAIYIPLQEKQENTLTENSPMTESVKNKKVFKNLENNKKKLDEIKYFKSFNTTPPATCDCNIQIL